jgi:predicted amidophosphoribosyltransferase
MEACSHCGAEIDRSFRFCPWCAQPQRSKLVEFFWPHRIDRGKALRVSRYLTDDPHVRFSVWDESGVARAAVSIEESEAERVALFLLNTAPPEQRSKTSWLGRALAHRGS